MQYLCTERVKNSNISEHSKVAAKEMEDQLTEMMKELKIQNYKT
jgi:hypothetical protein